MNNIRKQGGRRLQGYDCRKDPNLPVITVITVVFNGAMHLEQAINSVLDQGYPNLEYIIVDGGSDDESLEIIQKYEHQIDYWISEADQGLYFAMNKGINYATGDWVGTKNADDYYTPDTFGIVAKAAAQYPNSDVLYGNTYQIWCENPLQTSTFCSDHNRIGKKDGGIDHRSVFICAALHKTNLFDTSLRLSADYDLFCKLMRQKVVFKHLDACISYKRSGGLSSSPRILQEAFVVNKKYFGLLHAVKIRIKILVRWQALKLWNRLLKLFLSPAQFAAFKSRKR